MSKNADAETTIMIRLSERQKVRIAKYAVENRHSISSVLREFIDNLGTENIEKRVDEKVSL